jgi:hypothetical protein
MIFGGEAFVDWYGKSQGANTYEAKTVNEY